MDGRLFLLSGATLAVIAGWAFADQLEETIFLPLDHPAILYNQSPAEDPIARLNRQLDKGKAKLEHNPARLGYLPSILKTLDINIDSQVLVFSKTSVQSDNIDPRSPRAIYFNDDVTVGYVRGGGVLEFTALDPKLGIKLYVMGEEKVLRPRFAQSNDCLRCHQGPITFGVPGLVISSVRPPEPGVSVLHSRSFMTDHRTPFETRWGGWYVTGTHGTQTHLGNNGEQNLTNLSGKFRTSNYLTDTSDIVALMTLEHQVRMTNLLTRIGWDARIAAVDGKPDAATLDDEVAQATTYMLFADEAPLRDAVQGVSTFTKTFVQRGPFDKQGRSLREFDLKTRLFRYPLSYMIYSAAFDALPDTIRERFYRRIYDLLTAKNNPTSQAIIAILRDTKKNLPAYWQ